MNKQIISTGLVIFLISGMLSVVVIGSKNKNIPKEKTKGTLTEMVVINGNTPVFYYGNTCSHCADVEAWMKENDIEKTMAVVKKEVFTNRNNASEMTEAAKTCGLPTDNIGVPFLYSEGKCFIGSPDVINYLSRKAGIK
jgi:glutaredoxin